MVARGAHQILVGDIRKEYGSARADHRGRIRDRASFRIGRSRDPLQEGALPGIPVRDRGHA